MPISASASSPGRPPLRDSRPTGSATLTFPATGEVVTIGPGDIVKLNAGELVRWQVHELLRKVYAFGTTS